MKYKKKSLFYVMICAALSVIFSINQFANAQASCSQIQSQIRRLENIRDNALRMAKRTSSPSMSTSFYNQAMKAQDRIIALTQLPCR